MQEVEIRPLSADLIASFHSVLDLVAKERRYLTFLDAPPLSAVRQFILDGEKKEDVRLIAVVAEDVVGWCDISRLVFATKAHRGILGMGVAPAFRSVGIGLRLLNEALEHAWSSRFTRVELNVYTDNTPAISLYRKVGFVEEGIVRDAVRVDGRYRDAIAMAILRR